MAASASSPCRTYPLRACTGRTYLARSDSEASQANPEGPQGRPRPSQTHLPPQIPSTMKTQSPPAFPRALTGTSPHASLSAVQDVAPAISTTQDLPPAALSAMQDVLPAESPLACSISAMQDLPPAALFVIQDVQDVLPAQPPLPCTSSSVLQDVSTPAPPCASRSPYRIHMLHSTPHPMPRQPQCQLWTHLLDGGIAVAPPNGSGSKPKTPEPTPATISTPALNAMDVDTPLPIAPTRHDAEPELSARPVSCFESAARPHFDWYADADDGDDTYAATSFLPKYMRGMAWKDASTTTSPPPPPPPPPNSRTRNAMRTLRDHPELFKNPQVIKVDRLESLLSRHPNPSFVRSVMTGLRNGFWPWLDTHHADGYPERF
ncbi:hypothetical protein B0H14DRAFT_3432759 [Mycena olivaceomarginata]|nr:hypothetical protein B0H14DRAFT_3432759 [Mycena olivaceomarginata]